MKYPLEFIKCGEGEYNPTTTYPVYRLNLSGVTAYVRGTRHRSSISCRHTGKQVLNGEVSDIVFTNEADKEYTLSDTGLYTEFHRMHDLDGIPIGKLVEGDIDRRKQAVKDTNLKLGSKSFEPLIVLEAELEVRSKNKKAVQDPAATLAIKVKARVWDGSFNNWVLDYDPEHDELKHKKSPFDPDNLGEVLAFIKEKLASI